MPFFDYGCDGGHRTTRRREVDARDEAFSCALCSKPMKRTISTFAVSGQHDGVSFYDFEKQAWALATGQDHKTPREMEADLKEQGKEIVAPGWKPPKPKEFDEVACEQALDKIYHENHDIGEVG